MQPRRARLSNSLGKPILVAALLLLFVTFARADFLEEADRKLSVSLFQDHLHLQLSGLFDLEDYFIEQPAPGPHLYPG